jgi:hypothetical protein
LLHYLASDCCSYDNETAAIMEYLLEKGCDLNAVNKRGKTAYAVAIEYKNMQMVAALRRKGVMEKFQDPAGAMHGALRRPSFYTPPAGFYAVPADRQIYFELAIEDCNHYTVPYKKGWLFGPIVYGAELAIDKDRGTENFDRCMKIMGFENKLTPKGFDIPSKSQPSIPEKPQVIIPVTPEPRTNIIFVTGTSANIRSGAGNEFPIITTVQQGDKLVLIGEHGEWFNVRLESGQDGWINSRFTKE